MRPHVKVRRAALLGVGWHVTFDAFGFHGLALIWRPAPERPIDPDKRFG